MASILEGGITVSPPPSAGEGPSAPALYTGEEEIHYPTPLRSIEFIDTSGDISSEEAPLQRTRPGEATAAKAGQRTEPVPETEVPIDVHPMPDHEAAATSGLPAFAEAAEVLPSSPAPASRSDEFEDMFSDTPPATGEAADFGYLPIPRAMRTASRTIESECGACQ
ncbi:uncharacterized protein LOC132637708 [Lycium barbarum]|uniref:uncharacterized protein LOC132637708 n=1 Tax=Lycium barbarum TaxID=112863 RepID=UPI00293F132E|nr:uncharacterized protein LOC132637708 [Lycium barbarum]